VRSHSAIVVDDCSTDGTRDLLAAAGELGFIAAAAAAQQGKGAALRRGFEAVTGDLV
jgi:glycosyltransferase involved in cell wall biosynthesis